MEKINFRRKFKLRLFFESATIGIFTGAVISLLRFLLDEADIFRPLFLENLKSLSEFFLTAIVLFLLAKFLAKIIKIDSQVGGSGVPQIKAILKRQTQMKNPLKLLILKFISTVLGIGAGMSLGRAGVSVQFGSCVGKIFGKIFSTESEIKHLSKRREEILFIAGAGAGLSAIFSAPLAGVIFCIEELHKKFSEEVLIATVTASVAGAATTDLIFGARPIFETITPTPMAMPKILEISNLEFFTMLSNSPLKFFLYFILLGMIIGAVGAFFTKTLIWSLNFYDSLKISLERKIFIPLILIIPIGKFFPEILGCGNVLVDEILSEKFLLTTILILFAGKFLYTLICFGTNAAGGIFLPLLTLGALGGNIFASFGAELNLFSVGWTNLLIIFGMAAMFAAVVKAPVTGSILIMEVTGQFSYLLTLLTVSGAAFLVSEICGGKPIFSALLNRKK